MSVELKKLIEANPLFSDKFQFPNLKRSRLRTLINQGISFCKNPSPDLVIETLYVDNWTVHGQHHLQTTRCLDPYQKLEGIPH